MSFPLIAPSRSTALTSRCGQATDPADGITSSRPRSTTVAASLLRTHGGSGRRRLRGLDRGSTVGPVMGHAVIGQFGGSRSPGLQMGCIRPLTHWQAHFAFASNAKTRTSRRNRQKSVHQSIPFFFGAVNVHLNRLKWTISPVHIRDTVLRRRRFPDPGDGFLPSAHKMPHGHASYRIFRTFRIAGFL